MHQKSILLIIFALLLCITPLRPVSAAAYTPTLEEKQLLGSVNLRRIEKKLPVLALDLPLCEQARKRAEDYLYASGLNEAAPGLGTVQEQLNASNIAFISAAQNLSRSEPRSAAESWSGTTILDKKYTHAGVGIARANNKVMVVLLLAQFGPPMAAVSVSPSPTPSPTPSPPAVAAAPSATPAPTLSATPAPVSTPLVAEQPLATETPAATPQRNLDGTPNAQETELLKSINATRKSGGLGKYLIDKTLQKAAQNAAWAIAEAVDYKAKTSTIKLSGQLKLHGVRYVSAAQCVLHGKAAVSGALSSILRVTSQKNNLLSSSFTRMGAGVASRSSGGLIFVIYYTKV